MSLTIRLEETHQTTVITIEGDCAAVQVFYGDPHKENPQDPDAVMLYDASELASLAIALFQARIAMEQESVGEFLRIVTDGFGC